MYKQTRHFHAMRMMNNKMWGLVYFVFDKNGIRYTKDPRDKSKEYKIPIDIFDARAIDVHHESLGIKIKLSEGSLQLRCMTAEEMNIVFTQLSAHVNKLTGLNDDERKKLASEAKTRISEANLLVKKSSHSLMPATDLSLFGKILAFTGLPLLFMFHITIPEVEEFEEGQKNEDGTEKKISKKYWYAIGVCLIWLVVLCYVMNFALEIMGKLLHVSDGAMGLTFGAAGTSIPNLFSSMIVARQGQGDMAVANAFGSNLFCVYFVLGFGWWLLTLVQGKPYEGLRDSGVVLMVLILLAVLIAFMCLMVYTNFTMKTWHGHVCLFLYLLFLIFAFDME